MSLWLGGQLRVLRPGTDLGRCLISLAPLVGAALIATSRLADYRHDVYDVTAGTVLGSVIGWFSYRRYFPPLRSARCAEPYGTMDREEGVSVGWKKVRDEEMGEDEEDGYVMKDVDGRRDSERGA